MEEDGDSSHVELNSSSEEWKRSQPRLMYFSEEKRRRGGDLILEDLCKHGRDMKKP